MTTLDNCKHCGGVAQEFSPPGEFGGYNITRIRCTRCGVAAATAEKWNANVADSLTFTIINPLDGYDPDKEQLKVKLHAISIIYADPPKVKFSVTSVEEVRKQDELLAAASDPNNVIITWADLQGLVTLVKRLARRQRVFVDHSVSLIERMEKRLEQ